jgi:hypothetical protein
MKIIWRNFTDLGYIKLLFVNYLFDRRKPARSAPLPFRLPFWQPIQMDPPLD